MARFLQRSMRGTIAKEDPGMKRLGGLLPVLWVAGVTMLSSGCNTVEGVGRDLERAGDAIQDEAEETRDRRRDV
jgi:predicted small secreted protein